MGKVFSIGEALIDFIPEQKGKALKEVDTFEKLPGGAPANVAIAVAKYGGQASMITKLGEDAFGDFLADILKENGVEVDKVLRTKEANTALAFVSVKEDGERDFSFYRNPSADMLLTEDEVQADWFSGEDILHFCSVDLVECPMKYAHKKAIQSVKEKGGIVSFDPNIRLSLWDDHDECKATVQEFLPLSHIVKVSDEELEFITGIADEKEALQSLFVGDVKAVVYTKGADGAELHLKNQSFVSSGFKVTVSDTTGAGDAFIGGLLYMLTAHKVQLANVEQILADKHDDILTFANASGALTASVKGAIHAAPAKKHVLNFIQTRLGEDFEVRFEEIK
ncbi:carbohydrate kinase family protein [Bacillus massiliigorillae]|uniref:carbohydrate kinase family protein n=1 Tax=Bacillus massiliigorillae TaxID=1243664 RepID=UPI0003A9DDD7|nr:carbohydrate kinase [Bacillus massiliigorillae]